jgi:hypothetical protein
MKDNKETYFVLGSIIIFKTLAVITAANTTQYYSVVFAAVITASVLKMI